MTTYKKRISILLCAVMCLLMTVVSVFGSVHADAAEYTILDDFAGTEFDVFKYPEIPTDYSLDVVQLAETDNGSVVIYVYQPSAGRHNVIATSVNIATDESGSDRNNYELEILGSYKTLSKYKVTGLTVKQDSPRRYDISSIFRAFNSDIDILPNGVYELDELAYSVGQKWTVTTSSDGGLSYSFTDTETVEITDRYDGYIRYRNVDDTSAAFPGGAYLDRHYIAFSTDRNIDDVISADVYYGVFEGVTALPLELASFDPHEPPERYEITHVSKSDFSNVRDYGKTYSWRGVEPADEFLSKEPLRDEVKSEITDKQWVLSYLTTEFKCILAPPGGVLGMFSVYTKTFVSEVTMLQLNFLADGKVYSLGVVDDKATASPLPDNWTPPTKKESFWDKVAAFFKSIGDFFKKSFNGNWWVWIIIAAVVIAFLVFLPILLPIIVTALKYLFKGLWWLICLPFKGIAALVRKIKDKRDGA